MNIIIKRVPVLAYGPEYIWMESFDVQVSAERQWTFDSLRQNKTHKMTCGLTCCVHAYMCVWGGGLQKGDREKPIVHGYCHFNIIGGYVLATCK